MVSNEHILDEIVEVLQFSHRYSDYVAGLCPFHDDHRPSFFVNPKRYICLSCGANGKTSTLLEKLKPQSGLIGKPVQTKHFKNPWTKWVKNVRFEQIFEISLKFAPSQYLVNRGIDKNTQMQLEIGLLDNWIIFPIKDENGWIIGGVARAGEDNPSIHKYILPAGQDPSLLYIPNWDIFMSKDYVITTFGILDAVTLCMLGFSALSVTTGKHATSSSFDSIRKRIIIIPDIGEEAAAQILASKIGWRGEVALLQYSDKAKDINDLLWKEIASKEKIKEVINELVRC